VYGGKLFIGGRSTLQGASDYYTLAMFSPGQICLFGKNLNAGMHAIAGAPDGVYVAPNVSTLVSASVPLRFLAFYDLTQGFDTCIALPVGIARNEQLMDQGLVIHPNPNDGRFQVNVPNGFNARTVAVYDALGNEVRLKLNSTALTLNLVTVDLHEAGPGLYLVRICGSDGSTCLVGRVLVQ
jgi:hypothetical protein